MGKVVDAGGRLAARRVAHIRFDSAQRSRRIRIVFNETFLTIRNYQFLDAISYELTDDNQEVIGLRFVNDRILLVGKNLRVLLDDLQDEVVRSIEPFNPERHEEPKDGAAVVERCFHQTADEVRAQAARADQL